MRVLIYVNPDKDANGLNLKALTESLENKKIEYKIILMDETFDNDNYDALFVIGGDGTILRRTTYANKTNTPIIGINSGKLGYLSEFERAEIQEAVDLFVEGKLKKDCRATLSVKYKNNYYLALNDVVLQRIHYDSNKGMIVNVSFYIDDNKIDTIVGDGIIVSTPTGSTAYSLSAGGAILTPGINAFSITPISAHSLSQRPVIYSAESKCTLKTEDNYSAGLFIDGKYLGVLDGGEVVEIEKAKRDTIFLRRENSNFYKKLSEKLLSRNEK